uniref:DDE-1 domain-containing protein n=1 Tax=Monopterus albus TaxID=43700 RepID=A0A3Q3KF68_MONAL
MGHSKPTLAPGGLEASVTVNTGAKRVVTSRNKDIVSMESALAVWISDCRKNNIALDTNIIREKARQLYNRFTDGGDDIDDPQPGPSTGTTKNTVDFHVLLHGFSPIAGNTKVFNMDETGLFWKRMPSRTFIMKEEARAPGFKEFKDRLTLIMCGNAAGFMIKPALIYKSKNPRALKNKNKNLLPVHWMHNPKAWITKALTSDWFHQCFVPEVKLYLAEKGLEFKVLLLMDNAGGHAIGPSCQGVQIEFLPPNTTALIQPMDQGVIRAFKALYTRNSLQHLVEAMDEDKFSLKEYWCGYTIFTCLQNIQKAIKEMKTVTLNACWKKLWPEAVNDYEGFSPEEIHKNAVEKAVRLAKLLGGEGFNDMTSDDVNDLIETHSDPLTDEDLTELTKSASEDEDDEHDDPEEEHEAGLTLERLSSIVRTVKEAQSMAESWDPDMIRSLQFRNAIDGALHAYKNLLQQKKKQAQQLPITMYFSRKKKEDPGTATDDILPLEEAPDEEVLFEEGHE